MKIKIKGLKTICAFLVAASLLACVGENNDQTPWIELFDGETLEGWHIVGGEATYKAEDGAIVGTTVRNTGNTFLRTDKLYGDFILELDYKVDPSMNSGIQIRSNSLEQYRNGRVHGYQIEIDPSERAWSAGIFDEARRGWLVTLDDNPEAQKAFKQNDWNHYRIEAIADTIKTWINGVPAAFLIDDKTATGFIALQVHSIGDDKKEGTNIVWKNIRILIDSLDKYSTKSPLEPVLTMNNLTIDEAKNGWELLWDGKTGKGWRGAKMDGFPEKGWVIEDGVLSILAGENASDRAGGDIVTETLYGDFELSLDFKVTPGGNSGIKYYVDTEINKGPGATTGLEYQILDDELHPDAKLGSHEGSRTVACLYDLIQADTDKPIKPVGEWNTASIKSINNHVEHWLNGVKVLEYERKSSEYRKLVAESKYVKWKDFGELDRGQILLQDHGDLVSFRNIKIRPLASTTGR
ncbi:3-keto-disaccharide hydrolase [Algoriphagus chordae]|uniref:Uncharacterized protein DUF1080 n=1 Tax=Algoriphagus chordae TaxID=237019 RepID=A0A2W7QRV9_9BACT|nr:DUF1080 domain-containing protein [Algoriphagus chordae]PZX51004.1 uncharacterized protein DUF1080 [Algoriphagus chordae]